MGEWHSECIIKNICWMHYTHTHTVQDSLPVCGLLTVTGADEKTGDRQPQSTEETIMETNKWRFHLPKMCPQGRITSFKLSKDKPLWVLGQMIVSSGLKEKVMTHRSWARAHKHAQMEVHLDPFPRKATLPSLGHRYQG